MPTQGSSPAAKIISTEQGRGTVSGSMSLGPPASLIISPPSPDFGPGRGGSLFGDKSYSVETVPVLNSVNYGVGDSEPNSPESPLLSLSKDGFKLPKRLSQPQFARDIDRASSQSATPYQPLHPEEDTMLWPLVPPKPVTELAGFTSSERDSVCIFSAERLFTVHEGLRGTAFWGVVTACLHLLHDLIVGPLPDAVFELYYVCGSQRQEDHI